jgi:NAD(P)-dependent dehydrogenase (short-subunit alcohol dehydrogenase family)
LRCAVNVLSIADGKSKNEQPSALGEKIMRRLEGKVVAIAGAASGIGAGIVERLISEGASVAIGDIDYEGAKMFADTLNAKGGQAIAIELDIDHDDSVAAFVADTEKAFGGLDGFQANAMNGKYAMADTDPVTMDIEAFDAIMRTNSRGYFLCTRHAIPALLRRGGGVMLYTSSGAAHANHDVRPAYMMSKASAHALMRMVASKWGPDRIRANVIACGLIVTPKLQPTFGAEGTPQRQWALSRIAYKSRLGVPADIGAMSAHLISDDGEFITGQVISVDGGGSMRP